MSYLFLSPREIIRTTQKHKSSQMWYMCTCAHIIKTNGCLRRHLRRKYHTGTRESPQASAAPPPTMNGLIRQIIGRPHACRSLRSLRRSAASATAFAPPQLVPSTFSSFAWNIRCFANKAGIFSKSTKIRIAELSNDICKYGRSCLTHTYFPSPFGRLQPALSHTYEKRLPTTLRNRRSHRCATQGRPEVTERACVSMS